mgnify:CR=1 FL=1
MAESKPITSPTRIPAKGWKTILLGTKDAIADDNVPIVSAGVGFYSFLAIFPALTALISIYGLAFNPQQVQDQLLQLASVMPEQALEILKQQLESLVSTSGGALGWGVAIGILFSLWSAKQGTSSLFTGLDIAYGVKKPRGFLMQNAISLLFTFGAILLVILSMSLIVAFPALVGYLGLPDWLENLISWTRWVLLAFIVISFLSLIYKYAPARRPVPETRWVMPGAILATLLWLLASWGFSFYVSNFGNYGEMYGAISAVVVLMLWLFLTSFIILLGAELNAEIVQYTTKELKPTFAKHSRADTYEP